MNPVHSVLLFAMFAAVGCDQAFTKRPRPEDLVGSYHLSERSRAFLLKRKRYAAIPESQINLGNGFSVSVVNLPDCATNGFGEPNGAFLSGSGKWELEKEFIGWRLTLTIGPGGTLRQAVYTGGWLMIRGRSPPYRLEVTIGDPDSGETIVYERSPR